MSDAHRPMLFTKKRSTKRNQHQHQQQRQRRFHGAFTGGFSAGHYNTVGSKNGWKPSDEGIEVEDEKDDYLIQENAFGGGGSSTTSTSNSSRKRRRLKQLQQQQKPEDYMDDEDMNEWAGPTKVKDIYHAATESRASSIPSSSSNKNNKSNHGDDNAVNDCSSLRKLFQSKGVNSTGINNNEPIGKQLLKVLGWRERIIQDNTSTNKISYAYVPINDGDMNDNNDKDKTTLLSCKRLKRIEIQLSKRKNERIPTPKIDTYGMGYEPYKNAPEFQAHREMRKRQAEERARAASSSHGDNRMNVYRMSDLKGLDGMNRNNYLKNNIDDDDDDDDDDDFYNQKGNRTSKKASSSSGGKNNRMKQPNEQQQGSNQRNILAYETMEDFIGTKSSAGFSLHDDDDQVYDNSIGHLHHATTTKRKPDLSEYHNEVYEGSDSDVDDNNNGHFFHETNQNLSSTQMKNANKEKSIKHHHTQVDSFAGALSAWASDGKSSIGGFSQQHQEQKNRAVTSDGEPPLSGFELGGSNSSNIKRYPGPEVPADYVVTIHIFPNFDSISKMKKLSSQMKRQLQSENLKRNVVESHNKKQRLESHNKKQRLEPMAGPSFASLSTALKDRFTVSNHKMNATTHTSKTEITCIDPTKVSSKRTTILWQPSQLLCKRFNITAVPSRKIAGKTSLTSSKSNHTRPISETREETFFRTEVLSQLNPSTKSTLSSSNSNLNTSLSEDKTKIERPSFDLMKSIFEPTSDEDDSSNNGEDDEVDTSGHTSKDVKNRDSNISDEVAMSLLLEKGDDDKRVQKAVILLNDVNKTLGKKTDNPKRSEIDDRLSSDSSQSAFSDADSRRKKKHKKRRKKHRSKKRKDRHKDRKKR